jgi:uncharacterized protein (DUF302 family)
MIRTSIDHPYRTVRRELRFPVPYAAFTRALESLLGKFDPAVLSEIAHDSPERARAKLGGMLGLSGFALFQRIDHGSLLKSLAGQRKPAMTYVFGNALIALEMTRHEPTVGLYVPPRLYVRQSDAGGVIVTYDLPSSTLAQFHSAAVNSVAASLDAKIEKLIDVAAALALKKTRPAPVRAAFRSAEGSRR